MSKGLNLPNALARFEEAVRAHAFKGTYPLGDRENIQQQYTIAKTNLMRAISANGNHRYDQGVRDGLSRASVSPGNGDMGG